MISLVHTLSPSVTREAAAECKPLLELALGPVIAGEGAGVTGLATQTKIEPTPVSAGSKMCSGRKRFRNLIFLLGREDWGSRVAQEAQAQPTLTTKSLHFDACSIRPQHLDSQSSLSTYRKFPSQGPHSDPQGTRGACHQVAAERWAGHLMGISCDRGDGTKRDPWSGVPGRSVRRYRGEPVGLDSRQVPGLPRTMRLDWGTLLRDRLPRADDQILHTLVSQD